MKSCLIQQDILHRNHNKIKSNGMRLSKLCEQKTYNFKELVE